MSSDKKRRREDRESKKSKKKKKVSNDDDDDLVGYSNDCNPFNDSNLTGRFVWKKKIEQDKKEGKQSKKKKSKSKHKDTEKEERKRLRHVRDELEKARSRREERDRERQQWEEQMSVLDRERNLMQSGDWENRELSFHLVQAKRRSEIRIREGRAKSIDWLYQWVMLGYSDDKETEHEKQRLYPIYNPVDLIGDLSLDELEELASDIKTILSSDTDFTGAYETLLVLCQYEIDVRHGAEDVLATLKKFDVGDLFTNKAAHELTELQAEIRGILNSGGAVDVAYWEAVLKASHIYKARAKLQETHLAILKKRAEVLQETMPETYVKWTKPTDEPQEAEQTASSPDNKGEDDPLNYDRLQMLEENAAKLYERSKPESHDHSLTDEDLLLKRESDKGLGQNEEVFESEVDVNQKYSWDSLYRPRKPKYFNRVKTGYEWNKYNQTHYDQDNPPPKVIQGYKFNIFYPDLIDKNTSPTFYIERIDEDTATIRFHAGPPYEDVAFRIVNRDWESSHRKGYRCNFDRGVLQLWFNFKRYRYRR